MIELIHKIFDAQTTAKDSGVFCADNCGTCVFTGSLLADGVAHATIVVYGSLDRVRGFSEIATFDLDTTGPGEDTIGYIAEAGWPYVRASLTNITGSNPNVSLWMGC